MGTVALAAATVGVLIAGVDCVPVGDTATVEKEDGVLVPAPRLGGLLDKRGPQRIHGRECR
jgi:hypothetical protein